MCRCAYFVSAPTVRFLRTVERLDTLPFGQRRKIAARVFEQIKPLLACRDASRLGQVVAGYQDERWRFIFRGIHDVDKEGFTVVVLTEQWIGARLEVVRGVPPVNEILAEKRCTAVECFILDNVSLESFDIVELYPNDCVSHDERLQAAAA
jgi:hypothetical protein